MKLVVDSNRISDLNEIVTTLKRSPQHNQIFVDTRLPLSILTIKNPFNAPIQFIDVNGVITASGDHNCFIAISTQHTFLVPEKIPIYIIPADTNNLQIPLNYSTPR